MILLARALLNPYGRVGGHYVQEQALLFRSKVFWLQAVIELQVAKQHLRCVPQRHQTESQL